MTQAAVLGANASIMSTPVGTAPGYQCRAWVNFNGTGTVAIRASGNVTSITDNGTGNYTVNFTTAMTDANYSVLASSTSSGSTPKWTPFCTSGSASGATVLIVDPGVSFYDSTTICVSIFR